MRPVQLEVFFFAALLGGCDRTVCGPGTSSKDGVCVADDPGTDTGAAADTASVSEEESDAVPLDRDNDGYDEDEDCNDFDDKTHPGAEEICDGLDNNCDGSTDEDAVDAVVRFTDTDGDGFGNDATMRTTCEPLDDEIAEGGDCDDADVNVHPDAAEECDEVDRDCDGQPYVEGSAAFVHADGRIDDLTAVFAAGSLSSVVSHSVADDGSLNLCGGTFYTSLNLSAQSARVWAPGGPETTTLNAGSGSAVTIQEAYAEVELEGFTIQAGQHAVDGSAVLNGSITIRNSHIQATGNSGLAWASIWTASDLSVHDSVIRGGGAPRGIWVGGDLIMVDSELSGHSRVESTLLSSEHLGGGGYVSGDARIDDSLIEDNTVVASSYNGLYTGTTLKGGGLAVYGNLTMHRSTVKNNHISAHAYGSATVVNGAGVWSSGDVTLVDSWVEDNTAEAVLDCAYSYCYVYAQGAGVHAGWYYGGDVFIQGSTIRGNSFTTTLNTSSFSELDVHSVFGGGVYASGTVDCVEGGVIEENEALSGGGVYYYGDTLVSNGCSWGTGTTDNEGGDIRGSASGDYDSAATFRCEDGTCG